jgi:hypothetical protein
MRRPLAWLPLLLALAAAPAAAQRRDTGYGFQTLAFRGLGVDVGRIWPSRLESATVYTGRADLGRLAPNVRIVPSLTYWSSRYRKAEVERFAKEIQELCTQQSTNCPLLDLGTVRLSDLALGLDAQGTYHTRTPLVFFLGAGGALHLINGQGNAIEGTFVEQILDAISPGADLSAGLELPLFSGLRVFTEGRAVLTSNTRYASITVGGSINFSPTSPGARTTPSRGEPQ